MECNTTVSACNVSTPGSVEYIERSVLIQMIVLTTMAVLGIAGNIIILTTGVKCLFCVPDLQLRQDYTPSFVTNLAVADILILMYGVPLHLSEVKGLPMSEFVCRYLVPLRDVLALTSILTIMAISLERAVAILHPFSLESSQKYTRHWMIVIWIVSYLIAGLPMVFVMSSHSGQFCIRIWSSVRLRNAHQMCAILLIVIPGIITTLSYTFCIRSLRKFRRRRKKSVESMGVQQWSFIKQTHSVSRIALVLVAVFWLCNLPVVIYVILANYGLIAPSPKEHAYTMAVLTCLFFGASVMNPIVLIAMSHLYRESAATCVQYIYSKGNPIIRFRSRAQFNRESSNRSERISIANNEDNGENNNATGFTLTARK